jgi:hypothetical protein
MSKVLAHDADGVVSGLPDNAGVPLLPGRFGSLTDLMDQ